MVPHLLRAQSAYKDLPGISFRSKYLPFWTIRLHFPKFSPDFLTFDGLRNKIRRPAQSHKRF